MGTATRHLTPTPHPVPLSSALSPSFVVTPDDWVYDPKPMTKWVMARKWAAHVPSLPLPARALLWRSRDINVAVHFRTGDMMPTKEEWLVAVLNTVILPPLATGLAAGGGGAGGSGASLVVHVFVRSGEDNHQYKALRALPLASRVVFHAEGVTPYSAWLHLTQADVLLQSRSAFSEYASHVSTRPLSFAADGSRFGRRYQQCGVGVVCCREDVPAAWPGGGDPAGGGPYNGSVAWGVDKRPLCPDDARIRLLRVLQRRGLLAPTLAGQRA